MLFRIQRGAAALFALSLTLTACGGRSAKEATLSAVVSTEEIGKEIMGYIGPTPLVVTIEKGVITKVEALPNSETPRFFARVEELLLPRWVGMTVEEALASEPDAVSGATFSSKAVKANVRLALETAVEQSKRGDSAEGVEKAAEE